MNTRPFQDQRVTEVGLGCWQLGGDWGEVSDRRAVEILGAAYDAGVRFFDTAEGYGGGRSEGLIGRFLASGDADESVFVATKIGRGAVKQADSYTALRKATQASLERLGLETLDLTQLHCVAREDMERDATWEALRRLRDEGLIRHFGASVESVADARLCMERGAQSLQVIFSLFRQHPRDEFFDEARDRGVAIIVRLPLASGLLSGKFTKDTSFSEGDHRSYNRDGDAFHVGETFAGLPFDKGVELAQQVRSLLSHAPQAPSATPATMAQQAIRWVLDHDAVTVVIPGATKPEQATANAAAADLPPLSSGLHTRLASFYRDDVQPHVRGQY